VQFAELGAESAVRLINMGVFVTQLLVRSWGQWGFRGGDPVKLSSGPSEPQ
jgi:hypothetical protein